MNKNNFLLEILVQELPYRFIPSAIAQLEASFKKLFEENGLSYGAIKAYATPRRLAVVIEEFEDSQKDVEKDAKGPILNVALNPDGSYSMAALGFAKKNGATEADLYSKDNYIWAKVKLEGKSARQILAENIKDIILKLQGPHFMRWGAYDEKFSRPIENILALFNEEVLPVKIIDKESVNFTLGHRFAENKTIVIKNSKTYIEQLKTVNVYVDSAERRQVIMDSATKVANEAGLVVDFEKLDDLLDEVTYITEFPVPVICEFDKKYLAIPDIVTTTVMASHQRYFPLYEKDGKLSNRFITMANFVGMDEVSRKNIQAGNLRVICARLEDAVFFYNEDTQKPLAEKFEALKGMTFQRDLGTLYDKTLRIEKLSEFVCKELNVDSADVLRAARLSKIDLSTKLVFEFTELQGFIGENYAIKSGEKVNVANAIAEHYFPLGAGSELPSGIEGKIVSITDKIDTIVAIFLSTQGVNKKKRPSGSADPLGVRRAAVGVLRTVIESGLKLNLEKLIQTSIDLLSKEFGVTVDTETFGEIVAFIQDRLFIMYDKSYDNSVMASCAMYNPLADLSMYIKRVESVSKMLSLPNFFKLYESANRVLRIMGSNSVQNSVNETLFADAEEKDLYSAIKNIGAVSLDDIAALENLVNPIEKFFDKVLVMDKDESVKSNRLALLGLLREKFTAICDFSKIVISK